MFLIPSKLSYQSRYICLCFICERFSFYISWYFDVTIEIRNLRVFIASIFYFMEIKERKRIRIRFSVFTKKTKGTCSSKQQTHKLHGFTILGQPFYATIKRLLKKQASAEDRKWLVKKGVKRRKERDDVVARLQKFPRSTVIRVSIELAAN